MLFRRLTFIFIIISGIAHGQAVNMAVDARLLNQVELQLDTATEWYKKGKIKLDQANCKFVEHGRIALPDTSGFFSVKMIRYKGELRNSYIKMYALGKMALRYYSEKNFNAASRYWTQALEIAVQNEFSYDELHDVRVALNNLYFLLGDFEKIMAISSDGLHAAEKIGDTERMAHFNNVLGCLLLKLNNLQGAGNYFEQELALGKKMNDQKIIGHALLNLADFFQGVKNYGSAIQSAQNAIKAYRSLNDKSIEERMAFCNYKISQSYKLWGKDKEAIIYSTRVMNSIPGIKGVNMYDRAGYTINAAELLIRTGNFTNAFNQLYEGLAIARAAGHREYTRDAYEQIAKAYRLSGHFDSAFIYQQKFYDLRDSLANENNARAVLQAESNLQFEKQKRAQDLAIANQKMWRNVTIAVAILAFLILAFFYNRYRLRQKNFYQQQLMRQQNELFNAVSVAQEQERKRIAQDLHDSLGSVLSAARLKLGALKDSYPGIAARAHFTSSMQLLDEASSELRNISYNIMPATLSKLGLVPALKNLCENISSAGELKVTFITCDLERIAEQSELSIYRIVLELINNVVKHSGANRAAVQLIRYPGYINITVEDNGKGFDPDKVKGERTGIGLASVYARVEYMKGRIDIDSAPGKGATIFIEIPI
jgi:signal transduction histidine kinase